MKRTIGLDRELKLSWLDTAASLSRSETDRAALRNHLMRVLEPEIPAYYVRVNTCIVLIRAWFAMPPTHAGFRLKGLDLLAAVAPDQRLAIHWGMLLLAYPFFAEVNAAIGTAFLSQDLVASAQVGRKIAETWGERTMVRRCVQRVFQSLAGWGVLLPNQVKNTFRVPPPRSLADPDVAGWLIEALLRCRGGATAFSALLSAPEIFPFRPSLTLPRLAERVPVYTFREGRDLLVEMNGRVSG